MKFPVHIYWTLWWNEDHRLYGCPIEFNIHTEKYYILVRPFSKSQAYDWKTGYYTGYDGEHFNINKIVWKHITIRPRTPETVIGDAPKP
jgi:hypothetical protein